MTWIEVACEVADVIRHCEHVTPSAGRSDLDGEWGAPSVYTEWSMRDKPIMREWRFPSRIPGEPDPEPCRHEVPTRDEATS